MAEYLRKGLPMRELPAKPNLEQLKKQAKDLLEMHKSSDPMACKTLGLLDRFSVKKVKEILAARVTLTEARDAVAMQYGFHSWRALCKHIISMQKRTVPDGPGISEKVLRLWQDSLDGVAQITGLPAALVMRVVEEDIEVFLSSRSDGNPYKTEDKEHLLGSGLYCETVINKCDRLFVQDALSDPEWDENPDIKLNMISYLGFPLLMPDGEVFGTICVLDSQPIPLSEKVENLLKSVKAMIEAHLELLVVNHGLKLKSRQLKEDLKEITSLRYVLPLCSHCNKVRKKEGLWIEVDQYSGVLDEYFDLNGLQFTHTICPDCFQAHYSREMEQ